MPQGRSLILNAPSNSTGGRAATNPYIRKPSRERHRERATARKRRRKKFPPSPRTPPRSSARQSDPCKWIYPAGRAVAWGGRVRARPPVDRTGRGRDRSVRGCRGRRAELGPKERGAAQASHRKRSCPSVRLRVVPTMAPSRIADELRRGYCFPLPRTSPSKPFTRLPAVLGRRFTGPFAMKAGLLL